MDKNQVFLSIVIFICVVSLIFLSIFSYTLKTDLIKLRQLVETTGQQNQSPAPVTPETSVSKQPQLTATDSATCASSCQKELDDLKRQVNSLLTPQPTRSSTPNSSSVQVKEITIPLGDGETVAQDWTDISNLSVTINTANYSAIAEARFEATLQIPTAHGWMYARLFNKTDGHPVWGSEISSETDQSLFKQSSPITLDPGSKLYQVQMKSTLKDRALVKSARVKLLLK